MLETFDKYRNHPWVQQLADVRALGLVIFAVIMILMTWSGAKVIHTNYQLQQQIARQKQENDIQKLKNENLKLQNQYFNTPQYLELAARQNFGLAMPGEKELLVPKDVALKHVPAEAAVVETSAERDTRPFVIRNLQAWSDFFLHRSAATTATEN